MLKKLISYGIVDYQLYSLRSIKLPCSVRPNTRVETDYKHLDKNYFFLMKKLFSEHFSTMRGF